MQAGTPAYAMANEGLRTGIENSTGQIGLLVLNDVFPSPNTSVKFYYPNPVTYQVFDVTPAWNQNTDNGGFFVPANVPINLQSNIANVGNQPVASFNVAATVYDAGLNQIYTSTGTAPALAALQDTLMTFSPAFQTSTPGSYIYRTTTSLSNDMNTGNDLTDVEMVIVDTSQTSISLAYTTATAASGGINWAGGGNNGAGIYIEPPFYPVKITSLDFFIAAGTGGFTAEIRDDDGLGNSPGTLLFSSVTGSATVNAYNNVPVSPNVWVGSGGFYVGLVMAPDTTITLGTDANLPLSFRNYEIIGGSWAVYRNNSAEDFMIMVNIEGSNPNVNEWYFGASILISPNPFNTAAQVKIDFTRPAENGLLFSIYDVFGKEIQSIDLNDRKGTTIHFNLNRGANIPSGIYFYKLTDEKGVLSVGKMMVQ